MKQKPMRDERVLAYKRKIQSDGFLLVWLLLLASVLVQQNLYAAPLSQYLVEMVVFFAMSVYLLVANFCKGAPLYPTRKRGHGLIVLQSVLCGAVVAAITTLQNLGTYGSAVQGSPLPHAAAVAAISFVSCACGVFLVLELLHWLSGKQQRTIARRLDQDEQDD